MSETNLPVFHTPPGQVLIYRDGALNLQVRLDGQTVWLTQAAIAQLYQTTPQNITIHLKAIYGEGELDETATCKNYLQVRQEGSRHVRRSALCHPERSRGISPRSVACHVSLGHCFLSFAVRSLVLRSAF